MTVSTAAAAPTTSSSLFGFVCPKADVWTDAADGGLEDLRTRKPLDEVLKARQGGPDAGSTWRGRVVNQRRILSRYDNPCMENPMFHGGSRIRVRIATDKADQTFTELATHYMLPHYNSSEHAPSVLAVMQSNLDRVEVWVRAPPKDNSYTVEDVAKDIAYTLKMRFQCLQIASLGSKDRAWRSYHVPSPLQQVAVRPPRMLTTLVPMTAPYAPSNPPSLSWAMAPGGVTPPPKAFRMPTFQPIALLG